jgi:hypothetical protein
MDDLRAEQELELPAGGPGAQQGRGTPRRRQALAPRSDAAFFTEASGKTGSDQVGPERPGSRMKRHGALETVFKGRVLSQ